MVSSGRRGHVDNREGERMSAHDQYYDEDRYRSDWPKDLIELTAKEQAEEAAWQEKMDRIQREMK